MPPIVQQLADCETQKPASPIRLRGALAHVSRIAFLEEQSLLVAASWDKKARVYDLNTAGQPELCAEFDGHKERLRDVIHLEDDVVASVGGDHRLFTWDASAGEHISQIEIPDVGSLYSMVRLNATEIALGTGFGNLVVLSHSLGRNLVIEKRVEDAHSKFIWMLAASVSSEVFVSASKDGTVKVWSRGSLDLLHTLEHDVNVRSVAISNTHIFAGCEDGTLHTWLNEPGYPRGVVLQTQEKSVESIIVLDGDLAAIGGDAGCIGLISLSGKSCIARLKVCDNVRTMVLLHDHRIAVGGYNYGGFAAIVPLTPHMANHTSSESNA